MRRHNQVDVIRHTTDKHEYITTIERLKNAKYGTPRYKVALIAIDDKNTKSLFNVVYTTGFLSASQLAAHVVNEYERGLVD